MAQENLNLTLSTRVFAERVRSLKDEQERVQKKTFTNWMNTYLKQKNMKVENLFEDIKDGVHLLSLLEVLSGERLPMERGRLKRVHHVSNLSTALKFLETKKIKLVNINVSDIADGKPSIVLGLIWTIILYFQIEDTFAQAGVGEDGEPRPLSALEKFRMNAKKALLAWTGNAITKRYGIEITNFGKSWRDGLAFNAIIHTIRPDLVDFEQVKQQNARVNLEQAFSTAENSLGIPRLLDPEDVDVEKPDEKSIMTYVAQFLKAYPEAGEDPSLAKRKKNPAEQELADFTDLMTWLNTEADEVLQIVDQPVTDRQQEYMDYLAFKTEVDRREKTFKKLEDKAKTKSLQRLTPEQWKELDTKWNQVYRQTRMWLWKLDASLPGRLGKFGDWLNQAEEIMESVPEELDSHEDMANQLAKLVGDHKEFFKELEPYKQFFGQVKKSGRYDGEFLPGPQLDNLAQRLQVLSKEAPVREKKLEFDEYHHRILALREPTEARLQQWMAKLGRQREVEQLLNDYRDFVTAGHLFRHYDQTYEELKKRADGYKKVADPDEKSRVTKLMEEESSAWKEDAPQVKKSENILEETVEQWKRFSVCVDILTPWVAEGEAKMARGTTDEKQQFFSDLPQYEEKQNVLMECGQYLKETCTEPVAAEVQQTMDDLTQKFVSLSDGFMTFQNVEVIGKARSSYSEGVDRISDWLRNAEELLGLEVPCVHSALKDYLQDIDLVNSQITDMENDFKVTTKTAQSLVKDSSQDIVNEMLQTLNIQKEVIVRVRKDIPEKLKYLKAVLPNVESLETGISDLNAWLDQGEAVLATHKMEGSPQATEARLEKHKAFFSEVTYQKSIMESKNKVHQKVTSTKPKLENVNFDPVDKPMDETNQRFQACVTTAKDWEKKLENQSRQWRVLQQKQETVDAWLAQAEAVLNDGADDPDSLIRKHKKFFNRVDNRLLDEYLSSGNDILTQLDPREQGDLKHSLDVTRERWKAVTTQAPIRLTMLEFLVPEEIYVQCLDSAEQTLTQERKSLQRNENVKEVLRKHRQLFVEGQFTQTCTQCLEKMQKLASDVVKLDRRETSLQDRYDEHAARWARLNHALESTHLDLKQLPERWKDYNQKLEDFQTSVGVVEDLMEQLQNENLTSEEYKDLQNKFQKALRNMRKFEDDASWLQENLEELLKDSPDADNTAEQRRLRELLARFQGLQPKLQPTGDKSAIFSKAYDFRDGIDKRANWLEETQKLVMDQPFIDGLEDARAYLHEHENIMTKLESERPNIMADIEAGKRLQKDRNAPSFVNKTVNDLDRKWKDTNELAKAKHAKLKEKVRDWEQYENQKGQMIQYLKKAEAELEKPPATTGQELAQKDLNSKKELKNALSRLKGNISEMQKLNAALSESASRERRGPLKGELTDIDKRLENVSVRLNAKLADLEATIAKWTEYYKRLNHFCDWLNEKEAKLNEVYENKSDAPEEQLNKSKAIASEVYENHITLETLEKDAKGMSQNFRSRETAALRTKLASIRRQWESLCSRAQDRSSALTGSVAHWQTHQNLSQRLMPWIVKAEKYCATELPKCSSLEEARDLHELHQSFLRECEEQFPVFEKMNTEAGYLMDQPNMAKDMEALQKRWNDIISASEQRSHKVDKMHGAWTAYDQELNNFDEVLEKLQTRLAQEPNVTSTDVQVLEHELAICKTLQEEIRGQQPHLSALQRQFEQVKQHATPDGVKSLKSKHDAVKSAYEKISEDASERQAMLNAALRHRQDFYSQLQDFEKWLKRTQRKLDTGNEIYSDEVAEMQSKLKALKGECVGQEPTFDALSQEFKDLMKGCNEDEAAILSDRFDHLIAGYTKVEDLIKNREELCDNWASYATDHKDTQNRLKVLQAKLASPDITEDEVTKINKEVEGLWRSMGPWAQKAEKLDDLMATSQMTIKDRATQRTLHFGTEVQAIESMCGNVSTNAKQKEDHLGELTQLWEEFTDKKEGLVDKLHALAQKIDGATVENSSLQGIKDLVREIEDARDDLFTYNPEYEQLRELGRQIMQADISKGAPVQANLSEVNTAWDQIQALLGQKHQTFSGAANLWQQYNDAKQGVARVMEDVEPVISQDIMFATQAEVKKSLDQHKNAEFELHANQSQLDQMNNRGLQLLEELKNVPNFNVAVLEQDMDQINHTWETANSDVENHKENLEAQLVCWEQVQTGKEEVESWVNTMVTKLDDSLKHFDDAVSVESCLMKYKEEAPYFQEVFAELQQKVQDLTELNKDHEIPELLAQQEALEDQIEKATNMANKLENIMSNFSDERGTLEKEVEKEVKFVNKIKDKLAKCDDVSGTDEDLVKRLQTCRELQAEMDSHRKTIKALQEKSNALQAKYPSAETSNLAKDAIVLTKKFEASRNRADKIEDTLESSLEQHCQDAQLQQQRWLTAAKEKVAWCGDIAGDRYSVEAKLGTIKELMANAKEGEKKKALAASKIDMVKTVLPKEKQAELDRQKKAAEKDWADLVKQMDSTQHKLESSIDQWLQYDNKYEGLSQWLKATEAKVRNEASLKPDLQNKMDQLDLFNEMEQEVLSHRPQFEALKDSAQDISRSTGDGRTASYAGQLYSRYQSLSSSVKEQVEKCEENVDDHNSYLQRHKACVDWLKSAKENLEECTNLADDPQSLQAKIETVEELLENKEQGLGKFNSALESGEKLYPNTSNDGREGIRRELRSLREMWESFNDGLIDTQRQLESSRMQWSTFDDNYDQLSRWVSDMEGQIEDDQDLCNSLQEKKAVLQRCRTRCQDIMSHQTMIDSISDKGTALSSTQAKSKLTQLHNRYRTLCGSAQAQVKTAEGYVDQHQLYQDSYQQCRDTMAMIKDKLAVCSETTGDRQALQNRLDRVQDLMTSLRDGEKKVKATHMQGEKSMPQTGKPGQATIQAELEALTSDWEGVVSRLGDTQQSLNHALQAMQSYDSSCESLNRWLRDVEVQIKDHDLKPSLKEKHAQVEKFKALQADVQSKQPQFDELSNMASQVQGSDTRLVNFSTQLGTRYQNAKTNLRDMISRQQEHAREHEAYQENFAECSEWVDTLHKRLQVCADLAGDKHDVEDRLTKLQELMVEKEQGAAKIHYTVECGEKLYPSTASEGRDVIRQELRGLRDQWEQVCDTLSDTQRKLDTCLLQWSSYDENFEQFQKWLLDTEIQLREDTDLRATLPDKRAQLQNHRVLHQDIMSRQHVMDNLSEKATKLSHSSPVTKVGKFVDELHRKYGKLCGESKEHLEELEGAVKDHQMYQDTYQDCQDWLNSSREKVEACSDTSGDKMSIQHKLDRLKEFSEKVEDGDHKLKATKELCEKSARKTSQPGREVLRREMDHLQGDWEDYLALISQAEEDLSNALVQWGDFEGKFGACNAWLKDIEQQVKNYELKSTLKEKQAQVEKFKRQREEILTHQPEIDRFTDDAQNLMHTSADARLSTQVSQLTNRYRGLLSLVKDLITKWEKYVQDHQGYDNRHQEYKTWLTQATEKLDACQRPAADQDSMEERRVMIQMLLAEKDHGLQRLNSTIESGERLYPDTAATGREKVRQELRLAKDEWDRLFNNLNDAQRRVESYMMQWTSYADGQDQLLRWMLDTETALTSDVDLKNTLQEKRTKLQTVRALLQDVLSHQRLVDSVVEKAQGVLQSTSNPEVKTFITDINSRYENLTTSSKAIIQQSEQNVVDHQQYQDSMQAAVDWLTLMKDRVSMCSDTSGDRHTLNNKLDRVQELLASIPEGTAKIGVCEELAATTMETTALKGRQGIQQEMDMLKMDWDNYTSQIKGLHDGLERAVQQWGKYEEHYDRISHWVKDMEKKVKDCPLKSSLDDKQLQLQKFQALMTEVRAHQREMDHFSDEAQTLQQLTGEARVGTSVSQLMSRYQTLQQNVKDQLKKCEQNVTDHKHYKDRHADCTQWLNKAKNKFTTSAETTGSRNELEDRLEKIQELATERDAGFTKLNQVVEAGEKLYPNTAPDGREVVRQELRQVKLTWESLFDDLSAAQRKMEVALVQWTSFDDSFGQVEHWLREMESQLEGSVPLRSTLEEKKSQLQNYKVLHQDVLSYQRVMDSVNDKAQSLVQSSSDPQLTKFVTQARTRYQKISSSSKEHVQQYEVFVADHQQYNDAYNNCIEWLNGIREKLSMCADVSGDRHTIQNRLDKIQDIVATKMEGEPKVKNVVSLSEKVLPNTAPQGKDIVMRETDALKDDWEAFVNALQKTKSDLESCMDQWKEFDAWQEKVSAWLKEMEVKVRDTELKATLKDKQSQLDKLKKLHKEMIDHQGDVDTLSDAAQDLVRVSTDTRVISQASQLGTKYQTIYINVKELCRRWEQYVLDHQAYTSSFNQCKSWLSEMRKKLQAHSDISGDRQVVQGRLGDVQELMGDKEEGLHMLQIALDNLQIVLPNTSVPGRDNMRREMQGLQAEYDALSGDLNDLKTKLDGTLTQWTVYDDSIEQLDRWLTDLEKQLENESQQQNTLQEKRLQLERVKVLQLNVNSQQSTIDNLNDKSENLKQTSKEANLGNQIRRQVSRYERLLGRVKDQLVKCEKNVKDHQAYRDAFMETSDWLGTAIEGLNACSDVRGDRTAIEAQLHKLQDVYSTNDAGKEKLELTKVKGEIVLPETSTQGQDLIKEELAMLSNEFEGFVNECDELNSNLARLLEEWNKYEEQYNELSQWIKDTETDMKADSELKATLEDKTVQVEKQHGVHEEILNKQAAFDALAERSQTLLQSTTDNRVTSQLTQMSSRYTSLIAASKDLFKRYEQYTQDHAQYADTFTEAATWLQSTRDKVSVCADTSGDKFMIQSQLEKLQEFVVVKEEGQLLIHTANTWGEKTMTNTSMEGREMIRKELQQLQQEWENMLGEITDTKVMLESCLLQWTDYNDSYDKIHKWLRDMEKRLRETEAKVDLGEKKAELQRLKGLYQDVISYEQMIESIGVKATDLSTKSPVSKASTDTSNIVTKYGAIKDQAQELLAKAEQCVAQHQAYHDSCNGFLSWLRTAREKLATCSDTFGEKSVIITKIERAKALMADISQGAQRLTDATKSGETTLSSTSATGQTKIRQELASMKRDFEEYRTQLTDAQEDLERCLTRWNDFEESYNSFNSWLKETESYLRADLDLKSSADEKKRHWEQYQNYLEDVLGKQSSLDKVNEKAQALLQTNADAKTSHAITQLTTRYQGVIALSKDIVKNLEAYFENHRTYKQHLEDFQDWLQETQQGLREVQDSAGSKDDVGTKISKIAAIQAAMDQGHNYLRALLECSERVLPNTNQRGCLVVKQETESAKLDYENLLTDVSQAKRNLESALTQWSDFDRLYDHFNNWLADVENKLRVDPELRADLPEKRSSLEKSRALQADIAAHKDALTKLEDKSSNLRDGRPQTVASDLRSRFNRAANQSRDLTERLEDQVQSHEEYRRAYIVCLDWLANNRHRLQRLSDYSGDRRTLQDRLQQLKDFKGEMRQGQDMVNNATQLGERVCQTTAPRGQEAIHKELTNLKEDWNAFASSVNEMEANLEACIGNWQELDEEYQRFHQWAEKMEGKVKGLQENKPDQQHKEQQLMDAEDVFDEILKRKAALEHVKDRTDAVSQRSSDPRLSNNMMLLSAKYQGLVSAAKGMVHRLSENAKDHKSYNTAFDDAADWLAEVDERVNACNDTSGDWHVVQDRMDDIKDITTNMDEGLRKVNLVCDLAERILPNTSSDGKRIIEQQVTELTNEWEKLNQAISETSAMLEGVQDRWNDYEEYYGSLIKWLADMENQLAMDPDPRAQLVEKKTQLDKFKLVMSDIENHHRLVNELAERVANLEALSENQEVSDTLSNVQNRYDRVLSRAREIVAKLEQAYHDHLDFHEAQQDSEKWLLQTSFKLMSHNSLNVSTMELTQRQIDKHRGLIKEIESYRSTLDEVSHRGRSLVQDNIRVPKMAQQVQSQMQNLEESYLNLQTTAEQIRNRLADVMQHWQDYKDLLDRNDQYLNEEFPRWLGDCDAQVPDNLQVAQDKLDNTRAMWEKLNGMKQEMTNASHRFDNLGSMDSLDQSEKDLPSPVSVLADQVTSELKEAISQVEKRMENIRDTISQWESVDRQRTDLRNWLHSKQEELQVMEQRPAKLHAEAAELEIANLQALREEVQGRGPAIDAFLNRYRELTQHNPALVDPVMRAVREDWEELLGQIENLLEDREQALQSNRDLQEQQTDMDQDLANFVEELEKIEAADVSVVQKSAQLKNLSDQLDLRRDAVDGLRTKSGDTLKRVSQADRELVEGQIKEIEKRHSDVLARAARSQKKHGMLGTNLEEIQGEVDTYMKWLGDKEAELTQDTPLGYSVKDAEAMLTKQKELVAELEARQMTLDNVSHKVDALIQDLPRKEREMVEKWVTMINTDHQRVYKLAQDKQKLLAENVGHRELFQTSLNRINMWLQNKDRDANKLESIRLQSSEAEKQLEKCKVLLSEVQGYKPNIESLARQVKTLESDCPPERTAELQHKLTDVQSRYDDLKSLLLESQGRLKDSVGSRKVMEEDIHKVERWCKETEMKCGTEPCVDCAIEVLNDQYKQYKTLDNTSHMFESLIKEINDRGQTMYTSLYEPDKFRLDQTLKATTDRYEKVDSLVKGRLATLESAIATRSQVHDEIEKAQEMLVAIQDDLRQANKPLGITVEDAENSLRNYETIGEKMANYQPSIAQLNQAVERLRNTGQNSEADEILQLTAQYELLEDQVEQQCRKCQQAIALRQQYADQKASIQAMATEYRQEVMDIEEQVLPLPVKVEKLKAVSEKVITAEPLLTVLGDKAQQLSIESKTDDARKVFEESHTLRDELEQLKKAADRKSKQCEMLQRNKDEYENTISAAIVWLEQKEDVLAACNPLDMDTIKVDHAMDKHKALSKEALEKLDMVKDKAQLEMAIYQKLDEPLPPAVAEKMDQIKTLEDSIKNAISKKEAYLDEAKTDREQLHMSMKQITEWLSGAEDMLDSGYDGLDYDTLNDTLSEQKDYFSEASMCQDEMEQVMDLSERLLPTLDNNDRETLRQMLKNTNQKLANVMAGSARQQQFLELKADEWRTFQEDGYGVIEQIDQMEEEWAVLEHMPVTTPDAIHKQAVATKEFLAKIDEMRPSINDLNDKFRELEKSGNASSRAMVSKLITEVNARWNNLVCQTENKQMTMQDLGAQWDEYNTLLYAVETMLQEADESLPVVDVENATGHDLVKMLNDTKALCTTLEISGPKIDALKKSAQNLQRNLTTAEAKVQNQEQVMALLEKLERITDQANEQEAMILEEIDDRSSFQTEADQTVAWLSETKLELSHMDPGKEVSDVMEKMEKQKVLEQEISIRMDQMHHMGKLQETKYATMGKDMPVEMKMQMASLRELEADVGMAMKAKEEELQHIKEDRQEVTSALRDASAWLGEAELRLQERIINIPDSQRKHQALQDEFFEFKQVLDKLRTKGSDLIKHTPDSVEKQIVQKALADTNRQWLALQAKSAEHAHKLATSEKLSDAFDEVAEAVRTWLDGAESVVKTKPQYGHFDKLREQLKQHRRLARDLDHNQGRLAHLNSLSKQMEEVCDSSSSREQLQQLNQRMYNLQTDASDKLSKIEDATEEMEDFETELASLRQWMDNTRAQMTMRDASLTLKDQLAMQEKLVEEIESNKGKALLVLQKQEELQRADIDQPAGTTDKLAKEINQLQAMAREQCATLREAVVQQEQYEGDLQTLTAAINEAQDKLLASPVNPSDVNSLKKQIAEHNALASKIKTHQAKVNDINEKSRALTERSLLIGPDTAEKLCELGYYPSTLSSLKVSVRPESAAHDSGVSMSPMTSFDTTPQTFSDVDFSNSTLRSGRSGRDKHSHRSGDRHGMESANSLSARSDDTDVLLDESLEPMYVPQVHSERQGRPPPPHHEMKLDLSYWSKSSQHDDPDQGTGSVRSTDRHSSPWRERSSSPSPRRVTPHPSEDRYHQRYRPLSMRSLSPASSIQASPREWRKPKLVPLVPYSEMVIIG